MSINHMISKESGITTWTTPVGVVKYTCIDEFRDNAVAERQLHQAAKPQAIYSDIGKQKWH